MGEITPPEPLLLTHDVDNFDCNSEVLNIWLKRRAFKNEELGASRTYVVCIDDQVIGYYALATGSIALNGLPGKIRRNMPDPIPVLILGRLAVDKQWQQAGIGRGLLKDAVIRSSLVAKQVGIRALLVHALSVEAKDYYLRQGFVESKEDSMTLLINLKDALHHMSA